MPNDVISEALQRLSAGRDLEETEARAVLLEIMGGRAGEAQTAAFLSALRVKGETAEEIVGMARAMREAETPGVAFIHFNGAGGNVAAGKYNNGTPELRPILAGRLAKGMKAAWDATVRSPIRAADVSWAVQPVALPPAPALLDQEANIRRMNDTKAVLRARLSASHDINWMNMYREGRKIPLFLLTLGTSHVLYMPGELFVEYQLASQKMAPDRFVAMAAYGDYSPGYIGTSIAYTQGGYETGPVSRTAPEVEDVLMNAMRQLLNEATARR